MLIDIAFFTVLLAATMYLIFSRAELDDIIGALRGADLHWIIPAFGTIVLYIACEGLVLKILLKGIGTYITTRRALVYASTDVYFSALTPSATGGQPAISYYMSKDGISVGQSGSSIVVYLLSYKTVLIGYVIAVLVFNPNALLSQPVAMRVLMYAGIVINIIIFLFLVLSIIKPVIVEHTVNFVGRVLVKLHLVKYAARTKAKFSNVGHEYCECAKQFSGKRRVLISALILTFIQRTALFSVVWFVYKAFGGNTYNIFQVMSYQILISSSVDMLPLPGAIGATEISFLTVFENVFTTDLIMSAMLVSRLFNYYLTLIICACATLFNVLRLARKGASKGEKKE